MAGTFGKSGGAADWPLLARLRGLIGAVAGFATTTMVLAGPAAAAEAEDVEALKALVQNLTSQVSKLEGQVDELSRRSTMKPGMALCFFGNSVPDDFFEPGSARQEWPGWAFQGLPGTQMPSFQDAYLRSTENAADVGVRKPASLEGKVNIGTAGLSVLWREHWNGFALELDPVSFPTPSLAQHAQQFTLQTKTSITQDGKNLTGTAQWRLSPFGVPSGEVSISTPWIPLPTDAQVAVQNIGCRLIIKK